MRLFFSPDRPRVDDVVSLNANVLDDVGAPLNRGTVAVQVVSPSGKTKTVQLEPGEMYCMIHYELLPLVIENIPNISTGELY